MLETIRARPSGGSITFVQALVREVAYRSLAKADRRARHLAAARYFEALGDDELAGVLATHYLEAYRASRAGTGGRCAGRPGPDRLAAAADRASALHSHARRSLTSNRR